jgi:hypothetical protein
VSEANDNRQHHQLEVRVNVAETLGLPGRVEIAATAHFPDRSALHEPPVVIFGVPGGGYSRGYFDMRFPGHSGYSEAEFHVARGCIFVGCDPIGVGESVGPTGRRDNEALIP